MSTECDIYKGVCDTLYNCHQYRDGLSCLVRFGQYGGGAGAVCDGLCSNVGVRVFPLFIFERLFHC